MPKANLKTLEECQTLKKYERYDYWAVMNARGYAMPWEFGCQDWHHDETGAVNFWVPPNPDADLPDDGVPLEDQRYKVEQETAQWDNMQHGWSAMVDLGLVNDYWRHYNEWN